MRSPIPKNYSRCDRFFVEYSRVDLRCLTLPPLAVSRVPQDNILMPSSLQFLAALISLSMPLVWQLGQSQVRISRGKLSTTFRQLLQVLLEGKNLSICRKTFPSFCTCTQGN